MGDRRRIDIAFGLIKNGWLIITEFRTESQAGHERWSREHDTNAVRNEIDRLINELFLKIDSDIDTDLPSKEQLNQAFGYTKNARLMLEKGKIEPQAGHAHWARNES